MHTKHQAQAYITTINTVGNRVLEQNIKEACFGWDGQEKPP